MFVFIRKQLPICISNFQMLCRNLSNYPNHTSDKQCEGVRSEDPELIHFEVLKGLDKLLDFMYSCMAPEYILELSGGITW